MRPRSAPPERSFRSSSAGERGAALAHAHVVVAAAALVVGEDELRDGVARNAEGAEIDGIPGLVGTGVPDIAPGLRVGPRRGAPVADDVELDIGSDFGIGLDPGGTGAVGLDEQGGGVDSPALGIVEPDDSIERGAIGTNTGVPSLGGVLVGDHDLRDLSASDAEAAQVLRDPVRAVPHREAGVGLDVGPRVPVAEQCELDVAGVAGVGLDTRAGVRLNVHHHVVLAVAVCWVEIEAAVETGAEGANPAGFGVAAFVAGDGDLQDSVARHVEGAAAQVHDLPGARVARRPGLEALDVVQYGVPALLGRRAEGNRGLDVARRVLEIPVAAQGGRTGEIRARRHVGAGERGEGVDQCLPFAAGGQVAAVDEEVGVVRQRTPPAGQGFGALRQALQAEPGAAQLNALVSSVRDQVNGVEVVVVGGEDLSDLLDAVAVGVEQPDLHTAIPQVAEELLAGPRRRHRRSPARGPMRAARPQRFRCRAPRPRPRPRPRARRARAAPPRATRPEDRRRAGDEAPAAPRPHAGARGGGHAYPWDRRVSPWGYSDPSGEGSRCHRSPNPNA